MTTYEQTKKELQEKGYTLTVLAHACRYANCPACRDSAGENVAWESGIGDDWAKPKLTQGRRNRAENRTENRHE